MTNKFDPEKLIDMGELQLSPEQEKELHAKQEEADKDIDEKGYGIQDQNVHLRMSLKEVNRAKKLAAHKGLKYQTLLKMIIKEGLDHYEKIG